MKKEENAGEGQMLTGSDILIYLMLYNLVEMRLNTTIQMERFTVSAERRGKKVVLDDCRYRKWNR